MCWSLWKTMCGSGPSFRWKARTAFCILLTCFVCSISSLCLLVFSYLLLSPTSSCSIPYLSCHPGPYLSACCLVPSCLSWPFTSPQSLSCQLMYFSVHPLLPPFLLYVVKTLDISPVPGGIYPYSWITVLKNSLPYFLLSYMSFDLFLLGLDCASHNKQQ